MVFAFLDQHVVVWHTFRIPNHNNAVKCIEVMVMSFRSSFFGLVGSLVIVAASVSGVSASNIVVNGSFENPYVSNQHYWDLFDQIPGWSLSQGFGIEIQTNGVYHPDSQAAQGRQWVELDSDRCRPGVANCPTGVAGNGNSAIYQILDTTPGQEYLLSFAFSPRPGITDNGIQVFWGNSLVSSSVNASGAGLNLPSWNYFQYSLIADSTQTKLSFANFNSNDTFGGLIDDVSVSEVPEPGSLALLAVSGLVALSRRRKAL